MISKKTRLANVVNLVRGMNLEESCKEFDDSEKLAAEKPEITVGEFLKNESKTIFSEAQYAGWLTMAGENTDSEVREIIIKRLSDPMVALQVYLRLKNPTAKEDKLLKAKFEGLLPTAEKELKEGKIERVK